MDWQKAGEVALATIGLIQAFKTGKLKDLPSWVWSLALLPVSVGAAAAFSFLPPFIQLALLSIAVGQLGYENLIQPIKNVWAKVAPGEKK